jgi:hypothetical protein
MYTVKSIRLAMLFITGFCFGSFCVAQQKDISNRPADVRVTFADSSTYKGSYTGRAVARFCGQTDPMHFGTKSFGFSYPLDLPPGDAIEDVTFSSKELVDGVKNTTKFYVSVNVSSPLMGHPAAYVVDTRNPNDRSSGDVVLSGSGPELTLTIRAITSLKEKLDLVISCHAPKK